jgi:hypothetical protein
MLHANHPCRRSCHIFTATAKHNVVLLGNKVRKQKSSAMWQCVLREVARATHAKTQLHIPADFTLQQTALLELCLSQRKVRLCRRDLRFLQLCWLRQIYFGIWRSDIGWLDLSLSTGHSRISLLFFSKWKFHRYRFWLTLNNKKKFDVCRTVHRNIFLQ